MKTKKVLVRKKLTAEKLERLEQIIIKQKNLYACINSTGVRHSTIKSMFAKGIVRIDLLAKIEKFCNSVEPKTK